MSQESSSISGLPPAILQDIFSYTTPNSNVPQVCHAFHDNYQRTMSSIGKDLIKKIDRTVWNPAILPEENAPITDEDAIRVFQHVLMKTKDIWKSLAPNLKEKLERFSLQQISTNPNLFTELVTEDEKALIELLKGQGPSNLENSSLWQKICAFSSIAYSNSCTRKIKSLPESFGNLTSLRVFWLFHNQLQSLPESFGNLSALTNLYLSNNQLQSLPVSFGRLSALIELNLQRNQLKSLPKSIGDLSALKKLILHDNQLKSLPESFGNLTALNELNLCDNELQLLPESIADCKMLNTLFLRNNKLKKLPSKLDALPLQLLDIRENLDLANDDESVRIIKSLRQKGCIVDCERAMERALQKLEAPST